jgi:hypothetical protein
MKLKEAGTRNRAAAADVSLVQLSADGVIFTWPEAVALVSQICRLMVASGKHVFDASTIVIRADGGVNVRGSRTSDADRSVHAVGELLRTHLVCTPHPVPLQMIVSQATCTPPFYRSIAEFAEALSFYSSSTPHELTRSVYERWRHDHPVPARLRQPAVPRIRAVAAARVKDFLARARVEWARLSTVLAAYAVRPPWMTHRALSIATAILCCIGVAGFAFAAGLGRSAPALVAKIGRANGEASAALASTMGGAVELLRSRFGPSTPAPANTAIDSHAHRPAARRGATRSASRVPAVRLPSATPSRPARIEDMPISHSSAPASAPVAPLADSNPARSAGNAPTARYSPEASEPGEPRVYSADDADVTPPVAVDRIPSDQLSAGVNRPQDVAAITIVVGEDGRVESATLVRRPATFHGHVAATLSLSAVKSWRFDPAMRNGWPVKYRTTVWLVDK